MAFRVPKAKSSPIANCMVQLVGVTLGGGPTAHCSNCKQPIKVRKLYDGLFQCRPSKKVQYRKENVDFLIKGRAVTSPKKRTDVFVFLS